MTVMLEQAVQNGIAFLNETYPNWREKVTVGNFDVNSEVSCPFSLASELEFYVALTKHDKSFDWARTHGFFPNYPYFSTADLQKEWERVLIEDFQVCPAELS